MRILMVCLGNICRSPIAEGILLHKVQQRGLQWQIASAGTESYHIGEPPHRLSQSICLQHGIDISGQRAVQLRAADFDKYDILYAMAKDVYDEMRSIAGPDGEMSKVKLFLNELQPGSNASVPDPYYGGADGFELVYDLIDRTCDAIIEKYK